MGKTKKTKLTKRQIELHRAIVRRHVKIASEVLGWYGAAAILFAYGLTMFGVVSVHDIAYLILNFTGAIGILTVATAKHVRQSILVNAFWAVMAGLALLKIILQV